MSLTFPLQSTFIALPLDDDAKGQFRILSEKLRPFREACSLQNPATAHLTLQYWQEVRESRYDEMIDVTVMIAGTQEPFSMTVNGVGTFGGPDGDHVLFLTLGPSNDLLALQQSLPWKSSKPFHAHITLARIREPALFIHQKQMILSLLRDARFEVRIDRLRLYAMIDNRRQTPLQDFPFSAR